MENDYGNSADNRVNTLISVVSLIAGFILIWFGYKFLHHSGPAKPIELINEVSGYWPLISAVIGIALLISGITGLLRGKVL